MDSRQYAVVGEDVWNNRTAKINAEVLVLTYGSIVQQLFKEYAGDISRVNAKLFQMGYNIGMRLIEDFYARTSLGRCKTIEEMGVVITEVAFKVFLNVVPKLEIRDEKELRIYLVDNPFSAFVELPPSSMYKTGDGADEGKPAKFWYSNILCGVIKGALEMCAIDCQVEFVRDILLGDTCTELKIGDFKFLKDEVPAGED